jgi:hypothetical protein
VGAKYPRCPADVDVLVVPRQHATRVVSEWLAVDPLKTDGVTTPSAGHHDNSHSSRSRATRSGKSIARANSTQTQSECVTLEPDPQHGRFPSTRPACLPMACPQRHIQFKRSNVSFTAISSSKCRYMKYGKA